MSSRTFLGALVFAVVLFASSPAEATCAWVLWMTHEDAGGDEITMAMAGHPNKGECEKDLSTLAFNRKIKIMADGGQSPPEDTRGLVPAIRRDGKREAWFFRCLPDTIDPRAPMGGGR
jgi:hypothetical protein